MCVMYVPSKNFFNSQHVAKRSLAISVTDGPLVAKIYFAKGSVGRWASEGHQQVSYTYSQPSVDQQWWLYLFIFCFFFFFFISFLILNALYIHGKMQLHLEE